MIYRISFLKQRILLHLKPKLADFFASLLGVAKKPFTYDEMCDVFECFHRNLSVLVLKIK